MKILQPYDPDRPQQIQFTFAIQYKAALQKQTVPPVVGTADVSLVSHANIGITTSEKNKASMDIDDNGDPFFANITSDSLVPNGNFRIVVPTFSSPPKGPFNVGLGAISSNGDLILSNFRVADPTTNVDIQPIVKFYISTGTYVGGTVINFSQSSQNAALCDATKGQQKFKVIYNSDGTWAVS